MIFIEILIMVTTVYVRATNDWPEGTYSLPRPITGCPPEWQEGMRYQDSENVLNTNKKSPMYHLSGSVNVHGVRQEFCTNIDYNNGVGNWPPGQYCIYRYGPNCPAGLKEGWIFWDDENDELIDAESLYRGYVPAGIYEKDTLIYTCCRTDGDKRIPMVLPLKQPFYLLAFGSVECQAVKGARVISEFVQWDDEDRMNRNDNSWIVPYDVRKGRWNTKIYYCFYEYGVCETNSGATCQNTSQYDNTLTAKGAVTTGEENTSKLPGYATTAGRNSGIAVAVGGSVAGVICGSAVLAYLVKKYLNKKAKAMHGGVDDGEEEEEVFPMPDEIW